MAFEAGFADGGPAAALAIASRRLARTADPAALRERFFAHPSPGSLRALVEIAGEIGLIARAFRADVASLEGISLPAVVHLRSPSGGEEGFGVLVERGPEGWVVEEGAVAERHVLAPPDFERWWTGVVVTFGLAEGAVAPPLRHAGPLRRAAAWLRGDGLVGPVESAAGRLALVGCVALAVAGAVRAGFSLAGARGGAIAGAAAALSALGGWLGHELYFLGRRAHVPIAPSRLASTICRRGTHSDCGSVLSSRWGSVFGVDLSSLGLAFFASSLALLALAAVLPPAGSTRLLAWLGVAFLAAVPESLWLIGVQVHPLRRICPLCMVVHAVVLACAGAGLAGLLGPASSAVTLAGLAPFALLHAVAFAGALGLLVPFLGLGLEARSHRTRLGWIAATPWGSLAEMIGRPRAAARVHESPFRLGADEAPFRLDALVHPFCPGCGPVVEKLEALVGRHADRLSVSFHFPPRDPLSRGDREMCAALYATGGLVGGKTGLALYREARGRPRPTLRDAEDGAEALVRRVAGDRIGIPQALAEGREAVKAADALYDELQRGTPTVLLNGKPWESSIEDLDSLLGRYPDLLLALLGVAEAGRPRHHQASV